MSLHLKKKKKNILRKKDRKDIQKWEVPRGLLQDSSTGHSEDTIFILELQINLFACQLF